MQDSPAFGSERFARHRLATMPDRIKQRQPLLETQGYIGYRVDDNTPVLDRNAHPLGQGADLTVPPALIEAFKWVR